MIGEEGVLGVLYVAADVGALVDSRSIRRRLESPPSGAVDGRPERGEDGEGGKPEAALGGLGGVCV